MVRTGHTQTTEILPETIIHTSLGDGQDSRLKAFSIFHIQNLSKVPNVQIILKRHWQAALPHFYCHQHYLIIRKQAFIFETVEYANVFHLKSMVSTERPYVYLQPINPSSQEKRLEGIIHLKMNLKNKFHWHFFGLSELFHRIESICIFFSIQMVFTGHIGPGMPQNNSQI